MKSNPPGMQVNGVSQRNKQEFSEAAGKMILKQLEDSLMCSTKTRQATYNSCMAEAIGRVNALHKKMRDFPPRSKLRAEYRNMARHLMEERRGIRSTP